MLLSVAIIVIVEDLMMLVELDLVKAYVELGDTCT